MSPRHEVIRLSLTLSESRLLADVCDQYVSDFCGLDPSTVTPDYELAHMAAKVSRALSAAFSDPRLDTSLPGC